MYTYTQLCIIMYYVLLKLRIIMYFVLCINTIMYYVLLKLCIIMYYYNYVLNTLSLHKYKS